MKKTRLTMIIGAAICALPVIVHATPGPPTVPEPSTVFAGALLLVPFGIGAARAIRKLRK